MLVPGRYPFLRVEAGKKLDARSFPRHGDLGVRASGQGVHVITPSRVCARDDRLGDAEHAGRVVLRGRRIRVGAGTTWRGIATVLLLAIVVPAAVADGLPAYNVDIHETSVSGLSSGAYMADQFYVANSSVLRGVGIVAGGPYYCAQGSITTALNVCMDTFLGEPDVARLFAIATELSNAGAIDDVRNLRSGRVLIFTGYNDHTVESVVAAGAREFYRMAGLPESSIRYIDDVPAGHAMITDDFGNDCRVSDPPYINDCDLDLAGSILGHLYGVLDPPATQLSGKLIQFDQSEFIDDPTDNSMNTVGYAYVPVSCESGVRCRVHVAFHGCRQTTRHIGDRFYNRAGYNEWADTNRIVMLYPQAWDGPGNPRGCWDWWGYYDPLYHTRRGRQMSAVYAMLNRLSSGRTCEPQCDTTPPDSPTELSISELKAHSLTLRWRAGAERDIAGYNVLQGTVGGGAHQQLNAKPIAETTFKVAQLEPSTRYFYTVESVDDSGNRSAPSAALAVTTLAPEFCGVSKGRPLAHIVGGRATWCGWWSACATGSGEPLGVVSSFLGVTVYEQPEGFFSKQPCVPWPPDE